MKADRKKGWERQGAGEKLTNMYGKKNKMGPLLQAGVKTTETENVMALAVLSP